MNILLKIKMVAFIQEHVCVFALFEVGGLGLGLVAQYTNIAVHLQFRLKQ